MIEAFIRKNGVTKCPAPFTPELRELHLERQRAREQGGRWGWDGTNVRRRRRSL